MLAMIKTNSNNESHINPASMSVNRSITPCHLVVPDINYYHCVKIVEILKETEANSRNIFGRYSSQRMKVSLYCSIRFNERTYIAISKLMYIQYACLNSTYMTICIHMYVQYIHHCTYMYTCMYVQYVHGHVYTHVCTVSCVCWRGILNGEFFL